MHQHTTYLSNSFFDNVELIFFYNGVGCTNMMIWFWTEKSLMIALDMSSNMDYVCYFRLILSLLRLFNFITFEVFNWGWNSKYNKNAKWIKQKVFKIAWEVLPFFGFINAGIIETKNTLIPITCNYLLNNSEHNVMFGSIHI